MRLGLVRGHVVLSAFTPSLRGTRLLIVEPITASNLAVPGGRGGGKPLIVADQLAPSPGQRIAFVEGREGANPYWPDRVPVDAYCSLIVDSADFAEPDQPTGLPGSEVKR